MEIDKHMVAVAVAAFGDRQPDESQLGGAVSQGVLVGGFLTDLAGFVAIPGSHGRLGQLAGQADGDRLDPRGDPITDGGKHVRIREVPGARILLGHSGSVSSQRRERERFQLFSTNSACRATARTRSSEWRGPTICKPTGSPARVVPTGMLMAGCWVMLNA